MESILRTANLRTKSDCETLTVFERLELVTLKSISCGATMPLEKYLRVNDQQ